jgi:3-hydroxyisobutyrate dehydrogenase
MAVQQREHHDQLEMKISFIGLGHMGAPMARNLIKAGHALVVFDIVKANVDALTAAGASAANSPQACAAQGELVITMLPSSPHVKASTWASRWRAWRRRRRHHLIDCSTIDPHTAREVARSASSAAIPWRTRRSPAARAAPRPAR